MSAEQPETLKELQHAEAVQAFIAASPRLVRALLAALKEKP